jgi:anti-sigma regulatory factor (Ser/Thr protein kinase)
MAALSTIRMSLPQVPASAAEARRQVRRFAAENDLLDRAGVALLVLSELVTNAVLHGTAPIQVAVTSYDDILRIEVTDGDPSTDRLVVQHGRTDRPGGRGLHIVNSLARDWGMTVHPEGKTVWAEVGLDSETEN